MYLKNIIRGAFNMMNAYYNINSQAVRQVLDSIPHSTIYHIRNIQTLVVNPCGLSYEDEMPYTDTKDTSYSRWKHIVQSVLVRYKMERRVVHYINANCYRFWHEQRLSPIRIRFFVSDARTRYRIEVMNKDSALSHSSRGKDLPQKANGLEQINRDEEC